MNSFMFFSHDNSPKDVKFQRHDDSAVSSTIVSISASCVHRPSGTALQL
jgi:hypothetical protein